MRNEHCAMRIEARKEVLMPFAALGLRSEIASAVEKAGYTEPTPIQKEAIPQILAKRDVVGIAQTGTGKTAAFVLPMLQVLSQGTRGHRLRALVIVPTRELAVQVEQNVVKYGDNLKLKYATIYGGVGENPQIAKLRSGVDLAIATPGRLQDLMDRGFVDFKALEFVVLDEADRMLDMGFLPSIRKIVQALPRERQTLLFSATFSKEIEETAREFLRNPKSVEVSRRASPADTVNQSVVLVAREQKLALLMQLLADPKFDSVLIFVRTKYSAEKIARKISSRGFNTATLHSNRSQAQRLDALKRFKAGEVRVLVATDIAARGIDVIGISHVINLDFPAFPEDYVHRIGRTGRAHAVGDAVSFVTPEEMPNLRAVEKFIGRGIPRRDAGPLPEISEESRAARGPQSRGSRFGTAVTGGSGGHSFSRGASGKGAASSADRVPRKGRYEEFEPTGAEARRRPSPEERSRVLSSTRNPLARDERAPGSVRGGRPGSGAPSRNDRSASPARRGPGPAGRSGRPDASRGPGGRPRAGGGGAAAPRGGRPRRPR
jgi:ATP-dependent RNA helicase RhlE